MLLTVIIIICVYDIFALEKSISGCCSINLQITIIIIYNNSVVLTSSIYLASFAHQTWGDLSERRRRRRERQRKRDKRRSKDEGDVEDKRRKRRE